MKTILYKFYALLLRAVQLELAMALSAPVRNHQRISALQADEDEYSRQLLRLELGL